MFCHRRLSVPVIAIMGIRLPCVYFLVFVILQEVPGIKIQNKLLGKCLQAQEGTTGGRVSLGECRLYSAFQEWHWLSHSQALRNHHTGECLTAPGEQYEGVHLQPCLFRAESDETDAEVAVVNMGRDTGSQVWSCSKRGHLTLVGRGLHLSATQESTLIFLSREHKQPGSRWRTLDNQTLCNGRDNKHDHHQSHHNLGKSLERGIFPSAISNTHKQSVPPFPVEGIMTINVTETYPGMDGPLSFLNTTSADPTMVFFSMDYGMGWKITMLVLSSLALVLGTVILILQVYSNRRKKVVCVLKSYTPRPEVSVPGSPVPSERAPLTEHAMRLPHSSPTLQRGEILIQWKDGTVTPLYEA